MGKKINNLDVDAAICKSDILWLQQLQQEEQICDRETEEQSEQEEGVNWLKGGGCVPCYDDKKNDD